MSWNWNSTQITFDQTCWRHNGYNGCVAPPVKAVEDLYSGRGSGPTNGVRPEGYHDKPGYRGYYDDMLRESNEIRRKQDDDDIIELISILLTKGIM